MTDRQVKFVEEYLVDLNAAAAARRAGYAEGSGWHILQHPQVRAAIEEKIAQRAQECAIRQDRVLEQLGRIAFAEASDGSGAQIKLASQLRALELLGKHLGLFEGRGGSTEKVVVVEDV